jgi:maleylacetoacetate isomerase
LKKFRSIFFQVSNLNQVPTLVHDSHSMFQSLAMIEYIDNIRPEPRLLPQDPKERAYARALASVTVADAHPLVVPRVSNYLATALGVDGQAIESWSKHWTVEGLATYERLLERRPPAPFALGGAPGLADICIAGQVVTAHFRKMKLKAFPIVERLAERCLALREFAASHPFEQPGYRATSAAR